MTTHTDDTWYILGAGAIGCLWAAYWRQSGVKVILLTPKKRDHSTLTITAHEKNHSASIESLTLKQLSTSKITIQRLLVCTKSQHTLSALNNIKSNIDDNAPIIILQNGMATQTIKKHFKQVIYTAITNDGAYRTDQLSVVHAGHGTTFIDANKALLSQLPTQFLDIVICSDIEKIQWQKLAINCAINGLTAIYNCRNGELLKHPEAMQRITHVCSEISALVQHLDIGFSLDDIQKHVEKTIHTTANNYSSMYKDIEQGNTTEIEMLNGFICHKAEKLDISCPENLRIYTEIRQREQQL